MKTRLLLLLLVPLWLLPALVIADEARWEQYMGAAGAAYQRGDYEEAVGQTKAALTDESVPSYRITDVFRKARPRRSGPGRRRTASGC